MIADKGDLSKCSEVYGNTIIRQLTPPECPVITVVNGEQVACFPNIYNALGDIHPDHFISL